MKAILAEKRKEEEAVLTHKFTTGQITPLAYQWAMKGIERRYNGGAF